MQFFKNTSNFNKVFVLLAFLTLALAIPIALQVRYEKMKESSARKIQNSTQNVVYSSVSPASKAVLAVTATECEQKGYQCATSASECIGEAGGVTTKGTCSTTAEVCCIVKKPACSDLPNSDLLNDKAICMLNTDLLQNPVMFYN